MKSKEPKLPKEKKSEARPRKSSDKGKRLSAQAADSQQMVQTMASDGPAQGANGAVHVAAVQPFMADVEPPMELIRDRAYQLFVERGFEHGHHIDDWLTAERELKVKNRAA